jgi:hypothetical protein
MKDGRLPSMLVLVILCDTRTFKFLARSDEAIAAVVRCQVQAVPVLEISQRGGQTLTVRLRVVCAVFVAR